MTNRKKKVTKPAAYGRIYKAEDNFPRREFIFASDELYTNWLSRVTDDNPDYDKTL